MDYSKLSDFEINNLVANVLLDDNSHWSTWVANDGRSKVWFVDESKNNEPILFNPCNNPADAWPIILENKITVDPIGEAWHHNPHPQDYYYHEGICNNVSDKNPLRAAMIVFLKMSE